MSPDQPRWAQLRLQLLRYYVSAAESAIEQSQLEEAFALFGSALRLLKLMSCRPKAVLILPELLALAAKLNRQYSKRGRIPGRDRADGAAVGPARRRGATAAPESDPAMGGSL